MMENTYIYKKSLNISFKDQVSIWQLKNGTVFMPKQREVIISYI